MSTNEAAERLRAAAVALLVAVDNPHLKVTEQAADRLRLALAEPNDRSAEAAPPDVAVLAKAWISSVGDHHPGCLPPESDCPVGQEIADFVPRVAAAYARLSEGTDR